MLETPNGLAHMAAVGSDGGHELGGAVGWGPGPLRGPVRWLLGLPHEMAAWFPEAGGGGRSRCGSWLRLHTFFAAGLRGWAGATPADVGAGACSGGWGRTAGASLLTSTAARQAASLQRALVQGQQSHRKCGERTWQTGLRWPVRRRPPIPGQRQACPSARPCPLPVGLRSVGSHPPQPPGPARGPSPLTVLARKPWQRRWSGAERGGPRRVPLTPPPPLGPGARCPALSTPRGETCSSPCLPARPSLQWNPGSGPGMDEATERGRDGAQGKVVLLSFLKPRLWA